MTSRALSTGLALLGASLVALLAAAPAGAAFLTPEYAFTFSGAGEHLIGEATAVAVDEETHDVYVADRVNHRVEKFDSEGNFLLTIADPNPSSVAVDNSGSTSQGSVYVGDGTTGGGDGTISKFGSNGVLTANWSNGGHLNVYKLQKMGLSPFDGSLWTFDGEVIGSPGGIAGSQVSSYDSDGLRKFRKEQAPDSGGDGSFAIDSHNHLWFSDHNLTLLKEDLAEYPNGAAYALGAAYPGTATSFAVNPVNSDILATLNNEEILVLEEPCEPKRGYCTPKEAFGAGHLSEPRGVSIDGSTNSVYVAMNGGVAVFRSLVVPDVSPKPSSVGHTDATLTAHLDPIGAGDIVGCDVEYGPTSSYGTTVPCDQQLPMTGAGDATVHLANLSTEATYHFRFRATNGNGTSNGPDRVFIPHWVKGLETGDATDIGPGTATLHGELNPDGESTHYLFEWGETKTYGHSTPGVPGAETSAVNLTPVEASLAGLVTSATTYHYRLVAVNGLGTSHGIDREFTTPLAASPEIENVIGTATGLSTATLQADINPGFGDTAYKFQYGVDGAYGHSTVVAGPIGNDGAFHHVSVDISSLEPGTPYHFRVIAFNFSQHVTSADATFISGSLPQISDASAAALDPNAVRLSARVGAGGGTTTIRFEYGQSAAYGTQTAESAPVGSDGVATVTVEGLSPSTTYHFRAVATNEFGQAPSRDATFSTPADRKGSLAPRGSKKCKRGFARRKGKCVRKHRRHGKHGTGGGRSR